MNLWASTQQNLNTIDFVDESPLQLLYLRMACPIDTRKSVGHRFMNLNDYLNLNDSGVSKHHLGTQQLIYLVGDS